MFAVEPAGTVLPSGTWMINQDPLARVQRTPTPCPSSLVALCFELLIVPLREPQDGMTRETSSVQEAPGYTERLFAGYAPALKGGQMKTRLVGPFSGISSGETVVPFPVPSMR
jgi:hypothetical protein